MNKEMIKDVKKLFNLSWGGAESLVLQLPKEVIKMYDSRDTRNTFFQITGMYNSGLDSDHRLHRNIRQLINCLKSVYDAPTLAKRVNVNQELIETFFNTGEGLNIKTINTLASLVGLTLSFQSVETFYANYNESVKPPTIEGFKMDVYDKYRESLRLPPPSDVGSKTILDRVVIGGGDTTIIGSMKSFTDEYLNGSLRYGEYALALTFSIPKETVEWIRLINDETPSRVVMTIGSTEVKVSHIITSIDATMNNNEGFTVDWMAMVKIPPSKRLAIKFLADVDVHSSIVDFSQLRVEPIKENAIILGGI